MLRLGGPRCPPALLLVLMLVVVVASGRGAQECLERAVSTSGELELLPERGEHFPPFPREWKSVEWKVRRGEGKWKRILTAWKDGRVSYTGGSFPGGVVFQPETLSLRISPVREEDKGVYKVEFEDPSGIVTHLSFCVSVWDPIPWADLQAQTLPWEQGWCNISLSCSVPAPGNVSYVWKCSGDPPGALGHPQPRLFLQVPVDGGATICLCNVSNPVSWSSASADIVAL
ncbi:natural killer cell receptor 2B4, partial [Empidonax traillii]|uniref:natural killer cell receptor 2B4 n=1 Tax=Empidonax traillii TaxID=164674 RepID=UPI000FFD2D78